MLDRPIGGFLGSADGHTAECILFQLMAGFCAHKLPFWYERSLDKLKVYQYQNTPSKGVYVVVSQAQGSMSGAFKSHADDQPAFFSRSSSSARPNVGRYRPKFNSKSLRMP